MPRILCKLACLCSFLLITLPGAKGALSGAYTIDPSLSPSVSNYLTIQAAVSDLASGLRTDGGPASGPGVSAAVHFYLVAGTYNETISIPPIAGASPVNTITFDGSDPDFCKILSSGTAAGDYTLQLNGADHIRLLNLGIHNNGIAYGYALQLIGGADFNLVQGCVLYVDETATGNYQIPLITGSFFSTFGVSAKELTILDNRILGGKLGIVTTGASGTYATGIVISGNDLRSQEYAAIFCQYLNAPVIEGNVLSMRSSALASAGMRVNFVNALQLNGNRIVKPGLHGIYLNNINSTSLASSTVSNNMIGGQWVGASTSYGLFLSNCRRTDVLHNSVLMDNTSGSARAIHVGGISSSQVNVVNNIFALKGIGGHCFYTTNTSAFNSINFNDYWTDIGNAAFYGATYPTLVAWQAAYPALNGGSVSVDPNFVSSSDLHIVCSSLNDNGTPIAVPTDADGAPRSGATPDIGADEYSPIVITLDLGPDVSHCGSILLIPDSTYLEYEWSTGSTSPTSWIPTSGMVTLSVMDSNSCHATDSLMVTILPTPVAPFPFDSLSLCDAVATLSAENDGCAFLWSTGDTAQSIVPPLDGWYGVEILTAAGCPLIDSVHVTLLASPAIAFASDTTWFCLGDVAVIDAGPQPAGSSILWNTGSGTQAILVSAPGYYHCNVTTSEGCVSTDTMYAAAWMPPLDPLGADRVECGSPYLLDAANPGCSYLWSTGATTQSISAFGSATYSVTVTAPTGCLTSDTVVITAAPFIPVSLGPDRMLCDGSTILLNAGYPTYLHNWSTGATSSTLNVTLPGTYIVFVENPSNGCTGSDTVFVGLSSLSLELGPDQELCDGSALILDAGPAPINYFWSTGATTQTISVTGSGLYAVTATSSDGCNATDNIVVTAVPSPTAAFSAPATAPLFSAVHFVESSSGSPSITYSWDFGDGSTSYLPSPSHVFLAMLTYAVCLTVEDGGCTHTTCQDITIGAPIGTDDPEAPISMSVYPNPNAGEFWIEVQLPSPADVVMELIDLTGRVVHSEMHGNSTLLRKEVHAEVPDGTYLLRVTPAGLAGKVVPIVILR